MDTITRSDDEATSQSAGGAVAFIRRLSFDEIPGDVAAHARRCLIDLVGVAAAGARTHAARIGCDHAFRHMAGSQDNDARMLFDGRRAGLAGAAFAGATAIDAFDAHDGHVLCKGHVGVAVLPALFAFIDSGIECDDRELIVNIVLGYEIGTRAGIALHASAPDFHCSGAWNALAAAAVGARLMKLDAAKTREALGIAEYFGPRGPIMRVCDSPTMVKDGSGWGAHAGVTAALLARDGFTGAPAVTVEGRAAWAVWNDLGTRWRIREQYFKAYPVCRWAQPAVEAALSLQRRERFPARDITRITIESFHEAVVLGAGCAAPDNTDQAQYSLPYPVAAALAFGKLAADEIEAPMLSDPSVRRLLNVMELIEDPEFSRRFPAERWARVRIELRDGRTYESDPAIARGNPENPLTDDEIVAKFRSNASGLAGDRIDAIAAAIEGLGIGTPPQRLMELLSRPA